MATRRDGGYSRMGVAPPQYSPPIFSISPDDFTGGTSKLWIALTTLSGQQFPWAWSADCPSHSGSHPTFPLQGATDQGREVEVWLSTDGFHWNGVIITFLNWDSYELQINNGLFVIGGAKGDFYTPTVSCNNPVETPTIIGTLFAVNAAAVKSEDFGASWTVVGWDESYVLGPTITWDGVNSYNVRFGTNPPGSHVDFTVTSPWEAFKYLDPESNNIYYGGAVGDYDGTTGTLVQVAVDDGDRWLLESSTDGGNTWFPTLAGVSDVGGYASVVALYYQDLTPQVG